MGRTDTTLQSEKSSDLRRVGENIGQVQVDDTENGIMFPKSRISNDYSNDSLLPISNENLGASFVEWHRRVSIGALDQQCTQTIERERQTV